MPPGAHPLAVRFEPPQQVSIPCLLRATPGEHPTCTRRKGPRTLVFIMRSHTSTVVVSSVALAVQAAQFTWMPFIGTRGHISPIVHRSRRGSGGTSSTLRANSSSRTDSPHPCPEGRRSVNRAAADLSRKAIELTFRLLKGFRFAGGLVDTENPSGCRIRH